MHGTVSLKLVKSSYNNIKLFVTLKKWNFLASLAVIGSEEGLHRMQLLLLLSYYYRRCYGTNNCTVRSNERTVRNRPHIQFQSVNTSSLYKFITAVNTM